MSAPARVYRLDPSAAGRVRLVRLRARLTQAGLAGLLGVSPSTVCAWECERARPSRLARLRLGDFEAGLLPEARGGRVEVAVNAPEGQVTIADTSAAICAEDHVYDSRRFERCPACGTAGRIFLTEILAKPARVAVLVGAMLHDPDLSWTGPRAQEWREKLAEALQ